MPLESCLELHMRHGHGPSPTKIEDVRYGRARSSDRSSVRAVYDVRRAHSSRISSLPAIRDHTIRSRYIGHCTLSHRTLTYGCRDQTSTVVHDTSSDTRSTVSITQVLYLTAVLARMASRSHGLARPAPPASSLQLASLACAWLHAIGACVTVSSTMRPTTRSCALRRRRHAYSAQHGASSVGPSASVQPTA